MRRQFAMTILFCAMATIVVTPSIAWQTNWPEFRGPTGDGYATGNQLPIQIDEDRNVKWELPIHGKGWSSPVIWDEQIWLTTATEDGRQMSVICVDLESGQKTRDFVIFENEEPEFCHPTNSYASCTPAIEEGFVYVHFGKYGTACLDTSTGKVVWNRRDLECDHYRGPASSPILYQGLLIVAFDGADQQYVVALDKSNGQTVWKHTRDIDYGTDNGDLKKAYGTAAIVDVNGNPLLVYPSAIATEALRPTDGKRVWIAYHGGMNVSARPIQTENDLVIITNGMGKMFAIDPDGAGDITDSNIEWQLSKTVAKKASQVSVDGRIYMVDDKGVLSCIDAETGKPVWQKRIGGTYAASPIVVDDKIYFFSCEGKIHVIKPGNTFNLIAESKLGDGFKGSPAVSSNKLILRSISKLYCISE